MSMRALPVLNPLSYALCCNAVLPCNTQNDLQAVIKSIWIALPRLLPHPFALDRSFSADAICFCLQHTAWMAPAGTACNCSSAASNLTPATSGAAGINTALAGEASGTALSRDLGLMHRASSINGASVGSSVPQGAEGGAGPLSRALYAPGSRPDSSMVQEAHAFNAVLDWMLQDVACCADCQATRHVSCMDFFCSTSAVSAGRSVSTTPCGNTPRAAVVDVHPAGFGHPVQQELQCAVGGSMQRRAPSPASAAAGSSRAGELSCSRSVTPPPPMAESSQPQHPAMQSSRQNLAAQQATAGAAGASMGQVRDLVGRLSSHSVRSSYESDTTEGEADIRSMRSFGTTGGGAQAAGQVSAAPAPMSAFAASSSPAADASGAAGPSVAAGNAWDAAAAAAASNPFLDDHTATASPAAAQGAAAADKQDAGAATVAAGAPELLYSGCCCVGHQGMLLQMLAHLNWHLLEPRQLDKLDSLALLGPSALLEIYRCAWLELMFCALARAALGTSAGGLSMVAPAVRVLVLPLQQQWLLCTSIHMSWWYMTASKPDNIMTVCC